MRPLDAARRLTEGDPVARIEPFGCAPVWQCGYCFAEVPCAPTTTYPESFPHASDCPTLGLPRIVAALEVAEEAVRDARRAFPNRFLPPGHPLSDLALALFGRPTAIVVQVVPKSDSLTGTTSGT